MSAEVTLLSAPLPIGVCAEQMKNETYFKVTSSCSGSHNGEIAYRVGFAYDARHTLEVVIYLTGGWDFADTVFGIPLQPTSEFKVKVK